MVGYASVFHLMPRVLEGPILSNFILILHVCMFHELTQHYRIIAIVASWLGKLLPSSREPHSSKCGVDCLSVLLHTRSQG